MVKLITLGHRNIVSHDYNPHNRPSFERYKDGNQYIIANDNKLEGL